MPFAYIGFNVSLIDIMITHIRGILEKKSVSNVTIDVNGIGYEVLIPVSTFQKLPECGKEIKLSIIESVSMYGGGTTFYGFFTEEEKEIFSLLKDEVPGAGARKALDYLDKITKSLPDFRRTIIQKDITSLTGIFGFTKKTAEKLIASLKDKIGEISISGREKWVSSEKTLQSSEAVAGLVSLGYKESHARQAVEKVIAQDKPIPPVEHIIRQALRYL